MRPRQFGGFVADRRQTTRLGRPGRRKVVVVVSEALDDFSTSQTESLWLATQCVQLVDSPRESYTTTQIETKEKAKKKRMN